MGTNPSAFALRKRKNAWSGSEPNLRESSTTLPSFATLMRTRTCAPGKCLDSLYNSGSLSKVSRLTCRLRAHSMSSGVLKSQRVTQTPRASTRGGGGAVSIPGSGTGSGSDVVVVVDVAVAVAVAGFSGSIVFRLPEHPITRQAAKTRIRIEVTMASPLPATGPRYPEKISKKPPRGSW